MKRVFLSLIVTLLCVTSELAQSSKTRTRGKSRQSSNAKIPSDLLKQMVRDGLDCGGIDQLGLEKFAAESLTSERADLNGDAQPELIISGRGTCFGVHGISVWIYRKVGRTWKQLLSDGSGIATVAKSSTNGFRDVTLRSENVYDMYVYDYKFNGNEYKMCVDKYYARSNDRSKFALKSVNRHNCN